MSIRILVADDHAAIRRLLRRLLEDHHPEWKVCDEAADGAETLQKFSDGKPDLLVIDLAMPKMNGLQAAREIAKLNPNTPMLLLTVQQVSQHLRDEAKKAGFRGAVSKNTGTEVIRGLEALLRDETYFVGDGPIVAA
ncbi:MAG TPA: response regulator transcription factor [Terriglobales bacterium]|nr:response regulator transcription factor [Terriglobales bacterium]